MMAGRRIEIRGTVQGVGFRPWVYRLAHESGVTGHVANGAEGVTIEAFAGDEVLDAFLDRLRGEAPPAARIDRLTWMRIAGDAVPRDFSIVASDHGGERRASIPPDLATCDACLAEILDPADRRYRYAFTSCTACGPRFTIALDIPYDRVATTMAPFLMCEECQREYDSVFDRRFHAQPNACPRCGPTLRLDTAAGDSIDGDGDAIARAACLLAEGRIVAIKGLGGWHLACDATSETAVAELRRRKRRDEKPFAVMVVDEAAAEQLGTLSPADRALLRSTERPIVLVPRKAGACVVHGVAPDGRRVGLMLPYTPLHHLLLRDAGRPLVMTSGNVSEEPIACDDADARRRLGDIADAFLGHDRVIASRTDDSVAMTCAGRPLIVRRSRGYVPRALSMRRPFERPVLACGAHLKNTFCIGTGDSAYLGPHIGDLENLEIYRSYVDAIVRMERFLGVRPEIVAHDLHPDYLSTQYAMRERTGVRLVAVQHHHAHAASAMAEHGLSGPVIAAVFDGTGWGTDETSWGGEILFAEYARFERIARLRPLRLPGGDRAIRETWRTALAVLDDAFDGHPPLGALTLFDDIAPHRIATVRRMLVEGVNAPFASGLGRYFDALGAIGLARANASYEAQVAMAWDQAADPTERRPYPFGVDTAVTPWCIDLRGTVRAAVEDLVAGRRPSTVSARFHETVIAATVSVIRLVVRERGHLPVVLTGGSFQNTRLAEGVLSALGSTLPVHLHERVPAGDGGIALGQAVVADALGQACGGM
jgi:hydrogenase maturation protein HypF